MRSTTRDLRGDLGWSEAKEMATVGRLITDHGLVAVLVGHEALRRVEVEVEVVAWAVKKKDLI